ncbi:MAG: hypothetical protein KC561_20175, partial [Myxococcales bacterium]|nr:hypothetical protein [Myxococcales bacterium]
DLEVDGDGGSTIYTMGEVSQEGEWRTISLEPTSAALEYFGIEIDIQGLDLQGIVDQSEETGHERIEGTMNVEVLLVNGQVVEFQSQPTFVGVWIEPERVPEGAPSVCGDLCGITERCEPPADFPPSEFCAD